MRWPQPGRWWTRGPARKMLSENDPRCHRTDYIHTSANLKIWFITFFNGQKVDRTKRT